MKLIGRQGFSVIMSNSGSIASSNCIKLQLYRGYNRRAQNKVCVAHDTSWLYVIVSEKMWHSAQNMNFYLAVPADSVKPAL